MKFRAKNELLFFSSSSPNKGLGPEKLIGLVYCNMFGRQVINPSSRLCTGSFFYPVTSCSGKVTVTFSQRWVVRIEEYPCLAL